MYFQADSEKENHILDQANQALLQLVSFCENAADFQNNSIFSPLFRTSC